ncbi:nad-dependent deacetylase [Moniliophthora roreri MCA 2997]|uniref:Nad-dependent deacetylase n=1 Tax=Moniliophthora roreri (strain MCA 2997) TaxID=1381753 RepID=V2X6T9_MONRO|nr:nad-dependent deacetylase [Moniliophthora roreri MCA 2997]
MRVSVPNIPQTLLSSAQILPSVSIQEAIERVANFLTAGNVTVLTGAGVSVDSGIRAYRGKDGRYMNPNYKPIFYHELMDETEKGRLYRKRYWLRSYLGYPSVRDALPNTTHFALAALQYSGIVPHLITQNVDGLHHKAISISNISPVRIQDCILELHGTLHRVRCKHGHVVDRNTFQGWLSAANPKWLNFAEEVERTGNEPRTNPDGDVAIEHLGISYEDFVVPECPTCLSQGRMNDVHKPDLVFFGESLPSEVKDRSFRNIELADKLLLIGTTLATYSAFRLLKSALEQKKPVLMVNVGPSRADGIDGVEKLDISSGTIMREVVRSVLGSKTAEDPIVQMLTSGIVKPPPIDDDDQSPRAA